ncbi:MAG: hypothetical protein J6R68_03370 [Clostridia bacterium]|nr:hypothetical protein [Clostridia bacterium]MBO7288670.1 hypothetical protein [Clostridia bacterium]
MVKITNGISTIEVTRGAFEGIFAKQGFHLVDDENLCQHNPANNSNGASVGSDNSNANGNDDNDDDADGNNNAQLDSSDEEKSEDELFLSEIVEKPISQWNKDEIKRFAALKEINLSDVKNTADAKTRIKEFFDEQAAKE